MPNSAASEPSLATTTKSAPEVRALPSPCAANTAHPLGFGLRPKSASERAGCRRLRLLGRPARWLTGVLHVRRQIRSGFEVHKRMRS